MQMSDGMPNLIAFQKASLRRRSALCIQSTNSSCSLNVMTPAVHRFAWGFEMLRVGDTFTRIGAK